METAYKQEYERIWNVLGMFFTSRGYEFDGTKGVDLAELLVSNEKRIYGKNSYLLDTINKLLEQREVDKAQIESTQQLVNELQSEVDRLNALNEKFRESNIHYKETIDRLLTEREDLESRIKHTYISKLENYQVKTQLDACEDKIEELKQEVAQGKLSINSLRRIRDKIQTSWHDERVKMRIIFKEQKDKISTLEAQVQELTLRNQVLEQRPHQITTFIGTQTVDNQEVERLRAKVRSNETYLESLKKKLNCHAPRDLNLESQIAHLIREKSSLERELRFTRGLCVKPGPVWSTSLKEELVDIIREEADRKKPRWDHAAFDIWERLSG